MLLFRFVLFFFKRFLYNCVVLQFFYDVKTGTLFFVVVVVVFGLFVFWTLTVLSLEINQISYSILLCVVKLEYLGLI